jgi:hypothetical protein
MEQYTGCRCDKCNAPLVTDGLVTWCVRTNCSNHKPFFCGCKKSKPEDPD